MKVKIHNKSSYIDGYLYSNLTLAMKSIRKDLDMVFIIDGYEGVGKTSLSFLCASFVDPDFNLDRVCFNAKQFKEAVDKAKPYQAIIFDEAYASLSSRGALSDVNRALISMMTQIRYKNLFIFVNIPCFFELDKYMAVWRSRALLNCRFGRNFQRGYFYFYSVKRKKDLYVKGKKFYEYKVPANFKGRFTRNDFIDPIKYKEKKLKSLKDKPMVSEQFKRVKRQRNKCLKKFVDDGMTHGDIAEFLDTSRQNVSFILKGKK